MRTNINNTKHFYKMLNNILPPDNRVISSEKDHITDKKKTNKTTHTHTQLYKIQQRT